MVVAVKFPHNENTWNKVINEASDSEGVSIDEEHSRYFTVEYPSPNHFHHAVMRFDGMVEYEELS